MLRTSAVRVLWNESSSDLQRAFDKFIQIFSLKTVTSLKSSVLVAYYMHTVMPRFSRKYKMQLIQCGHILVSFFLIETDRREYMNDTDLSGQKSHCTGVSGFSNLMLKNRHRRHYVQMAGCGRFVI